MHKLNYYWMEGLVHIRLDDLKRNSKRGIREYQEICNLFIDEKAMDISHNINNYSSKERVKSKMKGIKIYKKIHPSWLNWQRIINPKNKNQNSKALKNLLEQRKFQAPFGKWHYLYYGKKGCISLIELKNPGFDFKDYWEIYSWDTLFKGTERFDSKQSAEKIIKQILK